MHVGRQLNHTEEGGALLAGDPAAERLTETAAPPAEDDTPSPPADLAVAVSLALAARGGGRFSQVSVQLHDGAVLLRGQVNSWHARQLAHHTAQSVAGVKQVLDELQVIEPSRDRHKH